jgi:hypothetical protein
MAFDEERIAFGGTLDVALALVVETFVVIALVGRHWRVEGLVSRVEGWSRRYRGCRNWNYVV